MRPQRMQRFPPALFFLALALAAAPVASAQLLAASEGPVSIGHHHLNVTDLDAHLRFWADLLGGERAELGPIKLIRFPNALIFLRERAPTAGTRGSTVNHIGFQVPDVDAMVAKLKAAGIEIATRGEVSGGRATGDIFHSSSQDVDLAFIIGPDDVKVELMENSTLDRPIVNHHIHFNTEDIAATKAWYVKMFGAAAGRRGMFEAADLPGVNLTFSEGSGTVGTKGRTLDHIGFEVRDLEAFCRSLEAVGVHFDVPFREVPALGLKIAFLTDPWGTYIELTEGLDKL